MHMETTTFNEDDAKLLTSWQAAKRIGITESWLRQLRHQGRGPTYLKRPGPPQASVRYRPSDVDAWIKEQSQFVLVTTNS